MIDFNGMTTRRGDDGKSEILGGPRMGKNEPVFAVLGDVDELTSAIGVAKALILRDHPGQGALADALNGVQADLVRVGTDVATPESRAKRGNSGAITAADTERLEEIEKKYKTDLESRREFIIPGADLAGAQVDVSRAVCRRAERQLVSYISQRNVKHLGHCVSYLNRLSDLLYVVARRIES
jgi:cob(I)alamin adenosyltransferase